MYRKPAAGSRKRQRKRRVAIDSPNPVETYLVTSLPVALVAGSVLHRSHHIILHDIDFDPSAAAVLRHGFLCASRGSIPHAHHINTVDRNVMVEHQVTH